MRSKGDRRCLHASYFLTFSVVYCEFYYTCNDNWYMEQTVNQAPIWPCSSVVECLHRNRKGHGFKSHRVLKLFSCCTTAMLAFSLFLSTIVHMDFFSCTHQRKGCFIVFEVWVIVKNSSPPPTVGELSADR